MPAWNPQANEIFLKALEIAIPASRAAYIGQACGDDTELHKQVDSLIEASQKAGSFLETPPSAIVREVNPTIDQPLAEKPGTQIGPYKLLQQIGEGGMGVVYMAEQTEPVKRRVALKIIKPGMDTRQVIARFEAERQALSLMDHPNIARVLDAGATESGRPFFVMELVKGQPITQYCDEKHLTPRQRLELLLPVCQAIQHAHQKGIIHRDIKPTNILVAEYDQQPVPKVIDFGVAKATSQTLTEKTMFTGFGQIVGTLEYMSPEQAKVNQLDIDTRSDIYSLGVLMYELLTGSTPFDRKRLQSAAFDEMLRIIREEEPPKPSTRLSDSHDSLPSISAQRHTEPAKLTKLVRGELDWIVMKALEKDRNRRYETANGFAADIQRYLNDETVQACKPSAGYRIRKFARRNIRQLATGIMLAVALLAVVGAFGWALRDRKVNAESVARERVDREVAIQTEVSLALKELDELQAKGEWPKALSVAQRAQGLLAVGGSEELRERVRLQRKDLEMVLRLEDVRLLASQVGKEGYFDWSSAGSAYGEVFREYGIDAERLPTEEAADRICARAGVTEALVIALDSWATMRWVKDKKDSMKLTALAQAADADPWRRQVRQSVQQKDDKLLEALSASSEISQQTPTSLMVLADALRFRGLVDARIDLLRRAQRQYPGDFWINLSLANELAEQESLDSDESISFYRAAVAVRPQCAAAHYNLAIQLPAEEAIASYHRALELDPKHAQAHCNLGIDLMTLGRVDEAIASFRNTLKIDPNHVLAIYNLGSSLRIQKNLPEAIANLNRVVELAPKWGMGHHELGNALLDQKKTKEAIASYRKAIELNPSSDQAHFALGGALKAQGQVDEAIFSYHKAIELNPKHAKALTNLGNILSDLNRHDEAIACFRRAIEHDPKLLQPRCNLGNELRLQGKLDDAIGSYRAATELDPKCILAHSGLGGALLDQKNSDEAIACFHKAIELDPTFSHGYVNLGYVLTVQGRLEEAVAAYRKATYLAPNVAATHHALGFVLKSQGKFEEELAARRAALRLEPNNPNYQNNLAWLLATCPEMKFRDTREAVTLAKQAVALAPEASGNWNTLGIAHYRAGSWSHAVESLEKSMQLGNGGDAFDWFFLAMAHWQLGDKIKARKFRDRAVLWLDKNQPTNEELRRFRVEAEELLDPETKQE